MDLEMNADPGIALDETIDRLTAAATHLEETLQRLEEKIASAEQKLTALEARAAELHPHPPQLARIWAHAKPSPRP